MDNCEKREEGESQEDEESAEDYDVLFEEHSDNLSVAGGVEEFETNEPVVP